MITDSDMRQQVLTTLDGKEQDFDVPGIVDDLQARFGTVAIEDISDLAYWATVQRHAIDDDDDDDLVPAPAATPGALTLFTVPRELPGRYIRHTDQVAISPTADPAVSFSPVRTQAFAVSYPAQVVWWDIASPPAHVDNTDDPSHQAGDARGFRMVLTRTTPEETRTVHVLLEDEETLVVRELLVVDPWERGVCGRQLPGGPCYIPAGHAGDCDPEGQGDAEWVTE